MPDSSASEMSKKLYKWWYDNIESKFYNVMIKWLSLPFGGERRMRRKMIEPISFKQGERILDMCCGTGGASFFISEKAGKECEITGMDLSSGQLQYAKRRQYYCPTRFVAENAHRVMVFLLAAGEF